MLCVNTPLSRYASYKKLQNVISMLRKSGVLKEGFCPCGRGWRVWSLIKRPLVMIPLLLLLLLLLLTSRSVWPDVGIKSSPNSSKSCRKVASTVLIKNNVFLKWPKKRWDIWASFPTKFVTNKKIAQYGHTDLGTSRMLLLKVGFLSETDSEKRIQTVWTDWLIILLFRKF